VMLRVSKDDGGPTPPWIWARHRSRASSVRFEMSPVHHGHEAAQVFVEVARVFPEVPRALVELDQICRGVDRKRCSPRHDST